MGEFLVMDRWPTDAADVFSVGHTQSTYVVYLPNHTGTLHRLRTEPKDTVE